MRFLPVLLLFILGFTPAHGQTTGTVGNRLALSVDAALNQAQINQQLQLASDLNIRIIETNGILEVSQPDLFYYLFDTELPFLTPNQLRNIPDDVRNRISEKLATATDVYGDLLLAVSLLRYPFDESGLFAQSSRLFLDSLLTTPPSSQLYYHSIQPSVNSVPAGFDFASTRISAGFSGVLQSPVVHFEPSANAQKSLKTLEHLLSETVRFQDSIVIIPAGWLSEITERNPSVKYILRNYTSGGTLTFPVPAEPASTPEANWSVILLFVIWASFVLHYRYQPMYSQSVMRYFVNHSFFVDDINDHRLRNALPGLVLLTQHALLTGLFLYVSAKVLLSSSGLEIFAFHFPYIMPLGETYTSFFLFGVILAIVLELISVVWIFLLNQQMNFFNQAINLYSWPMHLNLIVVTILVVLTQINFTDGWIFTFGVMFVGIWFFSFNIAAIDSTKFLHKNRILYLIGTVGLHVALLSAAVIYLTYSPQYTEPFFFALSAP